MPTEAPAAPSPPQQTNSPFSQPLVPPGLGSAQPLKPPTPGSRAWAEQRARAADPTPAEWAHMTPDQRFAHESSTRDRLDRSGPNFVHTRDRSGNVIITDRETGKVVDGDTAASAAPDQPAPPAVAQGEKFKIGQYEISEAELGAMMDRQAQEDLRRATVPASPEAYEAKLPADFKAPGGIEYKFDPADPSLTAARNWAHSKGLSQDDFSQLLSLHAAHVAGQEAVLQERARQEIAKAGVNAPQRVDAIGKWIRSEVGDADARPILASLCTDAHLRFYERLCNKVTSQGTAPFSQQHRDRPDDRGKVDDAQWDAMSSADRLNYTRQFDQKQFTNQR
jgi:hypothetical protein